MRPLAGAITDNRRERALRRTAGGLWMTLYGAGSSSVVWGATEWPIALAVWGLVIAALAFAGTRLMLEIRHIPGRQAGPRRFDRRLARNIAAVIAIYAIVETVSAVVLHAMRRDDLIFPVSVGIVGLHFWLFARVLSTRPYYLTGALDVLAVALTLGFTGPHARVGDISAWVFYPLAGGGVALFITAGLMLLESAKISRQLT